MSPRGFLLLAFTICMVFLVGIIVLIVDAQISDKKESIELCESKDGERYYLDAGTYCLIKGEAYQMVKVSDGWRILGLQ